MKSTGYIDPYGTYHKEVPDMESLRNEHSSTEKEWSHDRQRESHRKDMLQPYKNGQANPAFIEQYPQESKEVYGFI